MAADTSLDNAVCFGNYDRLVESPKNEWEQAYEKSVHHQDDLTKAAPGYAVHMFVWNSRVLIALACLAAAVVGLIGRELGVRGQGLFWTAFAAFVLVVSVIWWRRSLRDRR